MTEGATSSSATKEKRKLTTVEKRARTRRKNVVKKRSGSKGSTARSTLHKMEEIAAGLSTLSDYELRQLKKVVDALTHYRRQQQRIFKSIYERT
jgi:hypothetical protein